MSPAQIDPGQLLRNLGSGVLPPSLGGSQGASRLAEGPGFDQLLQQAQTGQIQSGIPIRVARQAGLDLSPSQLTRLADAADRAEAAGASRALVMIDGMVLMMDVPQRTITGQADLSSTKVLNGVDAVVTVAAEAGNLPNQAPPISASTMNASLLKILAGRQPGAVIPS
jgi:hypothetical protein